MEELVLMKENEMSERLPEVWKFIFFLVDHPTLQMPVGAEVLHVAEQNNCACLWARVDPMAQLKYRTFYLARTGQPIENGDTMKHHATFSTSEGRFVWHLFEKLTKSL